MPHPVRHKHASQDLARADTEVFDEDADGMFERVEAPSINLLRIWVCVEAWRLFEGLAHSTAVEALGLDPAKGVMVSPVGSFPVFVLFVFGVRSIQAVFPPPRSLTLHAVIGVERTHPERV